MGTRKTDEIFENYKSGEKTIEETNAALKESGAGFHLESLTDKERAEKKEREDLAGTVYNPNPKPVLPKKVNMGRRKDLIGAPSYKRNVIQETSHGKFLVTYDDQGYAVTSTRIETQD